MTYFWDGRYRFTPTPSALPVSGAYLMFTDTHSIAKPASSALLHRRALTLLLPGDHALSPQAALGARTSAMRHPGTSLDAGRLWGFVRVRSGACGAGTKMFLWFRGSRHPLQSSGGWVPTGPGMGLGGGRCSSASPGRPGWENHDRVGVFLKTFHLFGSSTFSTGLGARNPGVIPVFIHPGGLLCAGSCT